MRGWYCYLLILFWACRPEGPAENSRQVGPEALPCLQGADIPLAYARNFSIQSCDHYKIVHLNFHSDARSYHVDQKYVLVQRGFPVPALEGALEGAIVVEVPIGSLTVNNKAETIRLKELGLLDHVTAVGGADMYDADIRAWIEEEGIQAIGYGAENPQQMEWLIAHPPDVYLFFTTESTGLEQVAKMNTLGIPVIPHLGWSEATFLAKAEWIKFTALFFNAENDANEIFSRIEKRTDELIKMVADRQAVKVFGTYHPAGAYDWWVHRNDHNASLFAAAGATNLLADKGPTHYMPMNNERLLDLAREADIWICNSTTDERWPPANYLKSFKSYRNGQVYHYNKRTLPQLNAYDWQETAVARPDLVLEDLVAIFYPDLLPDHELLFFEKVKLTKL